MLRSFASSLSPHALTSATQRANLSVQSLQSTHQRIAKMWVTAISNKMLLPHHVSPQSKKMVWWLCDGCHKQFTRRVDKHVGAGGSCPHCGRTPQSKSAMPRADSPLSLLKRMRSRPPSSLASLDTLNPNRANKSVADDNYLSQHDRRILLPMLAKNFESERYKISPEEDLFLSPKLDGIRCVVSYNCKTGKLLFFSRAGTLFECCDFIEPALLPLFNDDPELVLDGELYNDSTNEAKLNAVRGGSADESRGTSLLSAYRAILLRCKRQPQGGVSFDALASAVRTSREKRSPETLRLQSRLQYHVFDVLYSNKLNGNSSRAFSDRYKLIQKLFKNIAKQANVSVTVGGMRVTVVPRAWIRCVPVIRCRLVDVNDHLVEALALGFEGLMIRRNSLKGARCEGSGCSCKDSTGVYAFGQRSSTLLKYKLMQDSEFVIVGALEGKGKLRGCLGAFLCRSQKKPELTFSVAPAAAQDRKREMWLRYKEKKSEFVGKMLTVQFQELTGDGVPRFPVGKCIRGSKSRSDWI